MKVVVGWGFEYKTCMIWAKDKVGMGYYARGQHELLLIAIKGNEDLHTPIKKFNSIIEGENKIHSKKPEIVYEMIEKMYPNRKYLELFARRKWNDLWTIWGNEAPHSH